VVAIEVFAATEHFPPILAVVRLSFIEDRSPIFVILLHVVGDIEVRIARYRQSSWIGFERRKCDLADAADIAIEMAFDQVPDNARRKRNLILALGEALLLRRADDRPIAHQRSR
jgi:hypothetical protein